ncbi:MAG: hypothetical protein CMJ52_02475 [Planctomycetaceae bacterium]|nr:hypothetical protein [Planctomycetaceae bacterium]
MLDLFSNVKFGILLLVVLFVYMSVGSAGVVYPTHPNLLHPDAWTHAQIRQWRGLEMTEFEWFHWWPFNLLMVLLCLNMTVTTLRRIPLNTINLGVWMIHTGIILLSLASVYYFATKIEGDAPVARRAITLALVEGVEGGEGGGVVDRTKILAMPGNVATLGVGDDAYDISVQSIDPSWELLSGEDAGARAFSVNLLVQRGDGERFIRQAIAGYPDYTEDLVFSDDPQQPFQRNVKVNGERIFDPDLLVGLEFAPTDHLFLRNDLSKSWALYLREVGSGTWVERPIDGDFLYNDYIADRDWIWTESSMDPVPIDPMDVPIPAVSPDDPAPDLVLAATGYLRYAVMRDRATRGGRDAAFNPTAWVTISAPSMDRSTDYVLQALDPQRSVADGGLMVFRALESESDLGGVESRPTLRIEIPELDFVAERPIAEIFSGEDDPVISRIGDTGYAYRVLSVQDDLAIGSETVSVAIIEVTTPKGIFRRWVFDDPSLTRDVIDGAPMDRGDNHAGPIIGDDSIRTFYQPGTGAALLTLLAGPEPGRLRLASTIGVDEPEVFEITPGIALPLPGGLELTATRYEPRAVFERKPFIVPDRQRSRDAKEFFARLRLDVPGSDDSPWLRYHAYPFDGPEWVLRRHVYEPDLIRLADGRLIEVLFSRRRVGLPTEVSLEEFILTSHIGDFDGDSSNIRNYTSMLRFRDPGEAAWSEPSPVSVNAPVEHDGMWFFQAQWDPPDQPRFQGDVASAGLNYTVLGVGNRNGVYLQLLGCVIAVCGMIYAFYVKPILKQRRREARLARARSSSNAEVST